jgi:hypothetical protein
MILAAFKRACAESRPDVAEHLLCALEALHAGKGWPSTAPGSRLAEAYRSIPILLR